MNAVNGINSNYISQYQTSELNSTTQKNDADALEKRVYEQANVKDSLEISSEAQNKAYAKTTKGLSQQQISSLKDQMKSNELNMIRAMVESVQKSFQNRLGSIFTKNNSTITTSTGAVLTAADFAIPDMPTNQADALAAISEGGAWSVDATASRIFNLAEKIANGDVNMLEKMRDAFKKGYQQAANAWGGELPGICGDTYKEVMKRFDETKAKWLSQKS